MLAQAGSWIEHFHVTSLPPVGGQKQYIFSPGNKIYFHAKPFHCFSPPTWPLWKPSIQKMHKPKEIWFCGSQMCYFLLLFFTFLSVLVRAYQWLVCYLLRESSTKLQEQLAAGKVREHFCKYSYRLNKLRVFCGWLASLPFICLLFAFLSYICLLYH